MELLKDLYSVYNHLWTSVLSSRLVKCFNPYFFSIIIIIIARGGFMLIKTVQPFDISEQAKTRPIF